MTSRAHARLLGSVTLRAVASTAIRPLLTGAVIEGRLLGAASQAMWIAVADEVVVLGTADAVRLPNGVTLTAMSPEPFDHGTPGDPAVIGRRLVVVPGLRADVVRWWDPKPALARCRPADVGARLAEVRARTVLMPDAGLGSVLASGDRDVLLTTAARLVGRGPGLTPDGDDVLAAAVATYRLMGAAMGVAVAARCIEDVRADLAEMTADRTTALAASLLRHACSGYVAAPVGRLLQALAGRGSVAAAVDELLRVGHSSGAALLAGVVAGVEAALAGATS